MDLFKLRRIKFKRELILTVASGALMAAVPALASIQSSQFCLSRPNVKICSASSARSVASQPPVSDVTAAVQTVDVMNRSAIAYTQPAGSASAENPWDAGGTLPGTFSKMYYDFPKGDMDPIFHASYWSFDKGINYDDPSAPWNLYLGDTTVGSGSASVSSAPVKSIWDAAPSTRSGVQFSPSFNPSPISIGLQGRIAI